MDGGGEILGDFPGSRSRKTLILFNPIFKNGKLSNFLKYIFVRDNWALNSRGGVDGI